MKILFLSQLVPYPIDAGPKVRSYRVLQYLAKANHEVVLVAFRRKNDKPEDIRHLEQYCKSVHTVYLRRSPLQDLTSLLVSQLNNLPFLIQRDDIKKMHRLLENLMGQHSFDAVHADQLWMAQYAIALKSKWGDKKNLQTVLDQHNAVFLIPQRLAINMPNRIKRILLNLESKRLARYEAAVCQHFDHVVWVTKEDQNAVHQQIKSPNLQPPKELVIPICVDPRTKSIIARREDPCRITFLGGLHWPPNSQGILWFARHVFPLVRAKVPNAVLTIIGKNPPAGLEGEGIEVTGYVTNLEPLLSESGAFIVPLNAGGGMRVKILDAWCWGVPVVSTGIGAEGLDARHEVNVLIADDATTFAQATIRLLSEPSVARQLVQNGRQTVLRKYNWREVYSAWNDIYLV